MLVFNHLIINSVGMTDVPVQSMTGYYHQQPFIPDASYAARGDRPAILATRPGMRMMPHGIVSTVVKTLWSHVFMYVTFHLRTCLVTDC
jgi:hypothetical protein